jgi:hypothetical protein
MKASAALACALAVSACSHASDAGAPSDAGADVAIDPSLAAEAFVWGYPLVVSERTMQNVALLVGVNTLFNQNALADATTPRLIVSPNQDTLYSIAVLDLRSEPMVLSVPDVTDRFWTYQFLDAWTDSFRYIGTRATSGKGGTFVIAPPGWSGATPPGAELITAPTPQMFLLGRYLVKDAADAANVTALARTLVPLHTLTGAAAPDPPPAIGRAPGTASDTGSNGGAFFDELGDALAINPPASTSDSAALARYAKLGIGAGLHPSGPATLDDAATNGLARIRTSANDPSRRANGWMVLLDAGHSTDDALVRAVVAKLMWGANVAEESVYPISTSDASGQAYSGATPRVLHFDVGKLPPVDETHGFWSLTLYGPDRFFADNAIHRFAIGDRTAGLATNADGSLDLFVQHDAPTDHEANWLPAPTGEYTLMLRLYLPKQNVLDGTYVYPPLAPQ